MPAWLLTLIKGIAISRLKDWIIENGLRWFTKAYVKSTSNEYDDVVRDSIYAIIDGKPSEEINQHLNKLIKLYDEGKEDAE